MQSINTIYLRTRNINTIQVACVNAYYSRTRRKKYPLKTGINFHPRSSGYRHRGYIVALPAAEASTTVGREQNLYT